MVHLMAAQALLTATTANFMSTTRRLSANLAGAWAMATQAAGRLRLRLLQLLLLVRLLIKELAYGRWANSLQLSLGCWEQLKTPLAAQLTLLACARLSPQAAARAACPRVRMCSQVLHRRDTPAARIAACAAFVLRTRARDAAPVSALLLATRNTKRRAAWLQEAADERSSV